MFKARSCNFQIKLRRLSAFEVSEIVVQKGIKSVTELQALASEQKREGKTDLAEFIVNRAPRVVSDIVKKCGMYPLK